MSNLNQQQQKPSHYSELYQNVTETKISTWREMERHATGNGFIPNDIYFCKCKKEMIYV